VCPCPTTRVRQPLSGETAPIGSEVDRRLLACGVPCHRSPGPAAQYFGERHFRAAKTVGSPPLHLHSLPSGLPVEDVHVTTALDSGLTVEFGQPYPYARSATAGTIAVSSPVEASLAIRSTPAIWADAPRHGRSQGPFASEDRRASRPKDALSEGPT
jgi:hypothetical protein